MMEHVGGYDVLQAMRAAGDHTPVMMLSGKSDEMDQVLGLGFGADSYLTKPFHTAILIQTAKALIRRSQIYSQGAAGDAGIRKGPFTVDILKMECLKNGEPLNFTAREMTLFRFLMEHPGQVFTKEQLYTQVWNEAVVDDNTITVYVKRIRNKIEDDPKQPRFHFLSYFSLYVSFFMALIPSFSYPVLYLAIFLHFLGVLSPFLCLKKIRKYK